MPPIRWFMPLAGLALVATLTTDATAEPFGSAPPTRAAAQPAGTRITLITGDRVRVVPRPGRPDQVVFEPAPGSSSTSAVITRGGGHTVVIPTEVAGEVAAGRLDRALFDVSTLIADRYDDARSTVLPVIVEYAGSPATARARAVQDKPAGARSTRVLNSLGARAVTVQKSAGSAFWRSTTVPAASSSRVEPAVRRILLDRRVRTTLDQSVPQIGAPAAWQRGLTGRGVKIAVLDTGIDANHPDLADRVTESANFSESPDTADRVGHGTHVASTVAGTGAASGGKYRGVAPDSTLLNGKVLGDDGSGSFSGVIAGMEWAAQRADVVNMSLGSSDPSDGTDPLSRALNTLSQQTGTLFVVAAGNCPPFGQRAQVTSPAAADHALAVSNLLRDGALSDRSCMGPRRGDLAIKPEIGAPGTGIVAARAAGTDIGDPVDEHYTALSGTSMATPHVAGTAGLLAQAHPDWNGDQLRNRLVSTADPGDGDEVDATGSGRVDADQATDASVSVDNAELEFGYVKWPHPDPAPVTRTLTYRNTGSAPVTLDLTAALDPGDQGPAPRLSTGQLVVPAGGQATVQVTADMAASGLGPRAGRVLATPASGGDPLVTTFGWYLEPEMYDLTINGVFRDGRPAFADVSIGRPDGGEAPDTGIFGLPMVDGTAKIRVAPGVYDASSTFIEFATDDHLDQFTVVAASQFTVSGDTTVTLDARLGRPVNTNIRGHRGLNARERAMSYLRAAPGQDFFTWGTGVTTTGVPREFFATPTAAASVGRLEFSSGARLELPPYTAQILGPDASPLPVADFYFGPRFTGRRDLVAVNAGNGSPDDLAGDRVRGKLAVITCTDTEAAGDKALAAEQAGAAAVLLYNPDRPGPNGVFSFFFPEGAKIPVMRTSRAAAGDLLTRVASGTTTIRITGVAETPRVYDLVRAWPGRVPPSASYVAEPDQFARVDETFGAQGDGMPTSESRTGLTPLGAALGGWLVPTFHAPKTRTSYVLGGPIQWTQLVVADNGGTNTIFHAAPRTHRPGERASQRWLTPVAASGLPDSTFSFMRVAHEEGFLGVVLSAFASGPLQFEEPFGNPGTYQLSVERNGEPLGTAEQAFGFFETDPAAADYRITLDAQRELPWWRHSTRVRSAWTFRSAGGPAERLPLVLADITVPAADATSRVATGRPTALVLGLRHQAGSRSAGFDAPKLEMSYDGNIWTAVDLRPVGQNRFVAVVNHPVARAGQSVSLRLDARDTAGGRLQQEVTSAYGLR